MSAEFSLRVQPSITKKKYSPSPRLQAALTIMSLQHTEILSETRKKKNGLRRKFSSIKKHKEGTYGKVYSAIDKETFAKVALKKQSIENDGIPGWILREIDLMRRLKHPNILQLNASFVDKSVTKVWMSLPWYDNSLRSWIKTTPIQQRLTQLIPICEQLLDAIWTLNKRNIYHYDIKSDNILIDNNGNIAICDFGLCNPNTLEDVNEICSVNYRPPELLITQRAVASYSAAAVDVWSLGCVFAEILILDGNRLFPGEDEEEVINSVNQVLELEGTPSQIKSKVVKKKTSSNVSITTIKSFPHCTKLGEIVKPPAGSSSFFFGNDFFDIVLKMLEPDYKKRITIQQLREHAIFKNYMWKEAQENNKETWIPKDYTTKYTFNPMSRTFVLNWLYNISELKKLPHVVLFNAVHMLDTFCLSVPDNKKPTEMQQLQLYAIGCLDICANYHLLNRAPCSGEYLKVVGNTNWNFDKLMRKEKTILETIGWRIATDHPFSILKKRGYKNISFNHLFTILISSTFIQSTYDDVVNWMIHNGHAIK